MSARDVKIAIFWIAKRLGLFLAARWATGKRLRILCYHGFEIDDESAFRPKLFMKTQTFERRMATVQASGMRVLALDEAVSRMYQGTLPRNAVAITIDDGFHAVQALAQPVLGRLNFPSTAYVTTYYVEHANPIFRLVVQYMFWKTRVARLDAGEWSWLEASTIDLADATAADQAMNACIDHGEKHCSEVQRVALCEVLGRKLQVPYADIVRSRKLHLMSPEQLREVDAKGMAIELHTHRHRFPADSRNAAEREIVANRQAISGMVGRTPRHFCYPSGLWHSDQWRWLDEMGIASSTTCLPGLNDASTPRHAMWRFLDGENIHALEFEAYLSGFSELIRRRRAVPQGVTND